MPEKINTSETDPPLSFQLTPESGQELSDTLGSFGFSLWGHGTGVSDPTPFFEKGVLAHPTYRGEPTLSELAIAITPPGEEQTNTIADPDFMAKRWPHSPGLHPNVVLLAIPNPDPKNNVGAWQIMEHIIDPEAEVVPPELVVGWYSPATNSVDLNPGFDLNTNSYSEQMDQITARVEEEKERLGDPFSGMPTPSVPIARISPLEANSAPPNPDDAIW
jgi:hypothetical protein